MCLICKKKTDIPTINLENIVETDLKRDLGLSNVYNIDNTLDVCAEPFNSPLYIISGATNPFTGWTSGCSSMVLTGTTTATTCDAVYNFSDIDEFTLTFTITGNTDYTGYTGSFCFHTFPRSEMPALSERTYVTRGDSILNICTPYSGITGGTFATTIAKGDLPVRDEEYSIRSYDIFTTKECNVGQVVNTFDIETQSAIFDYDNSNEWYFLTVTNPPKPVLGTSSSSNNVRGESKLVTERIALEPGLTTFNINGRALNNEIALYVNGILIQPGVDYQVEQYGIIQLLTGEVEFGKDDLIALYLAVPNDTLDIVNDNERALELDAFIVTGSTTGVTESNSLILNWNATRSRQEIFLTSDYDPDSNIIFVVNGITLQEDVTFFKSSTSPNKLIMDPSTEIRVGDGVSIFYFTNNFPQISNLGYVRSLTPQITWTINQATINSDDGVFLLEVTTPNDPNFLTPTIQQYVDYTVGTVSYSVNMDELPDTNENYIYRVCFFKTYNILFGDTITTRSCSDAGEFSVNLPYVRNTY